MDSLTQIALGAAVGELVLGKKAGNRAMLWGAIGGTLPDIDVMAGLGAGEISSLAYHRAITHSLTFAVLVPPALGWLVHKLYAHDLAFWAREIWKEFSRVGLFMFSLLFAGAMVLPIPWQESVAIALAVGFGMLLFPALIFAREKVRSRPSSNPNVSWKDWSWLLFWAIVTHPLLDTCTTFGTQLFQPFSDYRAAWNNIAVVDPVYTLPLLLGIIIAGRFSRGASWRPWVNYTGIALSSAYLLFTFINHDQVQQIFRSSLAGEKIPFRRMMVSPTLFNNILWQGVAETDSSFYLGSYSLNDQRREVLDFQTVPKNHHLIAGHVEDRDIGVLRWFSDGYFSIREGPDGILIWEDWRYGGFPGARGTPQAVFNFELHPEGGQLKARQSQRGPENGEEALRQFWRRIQGY